MTIDVMIGPNIFDWNVSSWFLAAYRGGADREKTNDSGESCECTSELRRGEKGVKEWFVRVLTCLLVGFLSLTWWHTILVGRDVSMSNQGHSSVIRILVSHASHLQSMKSMYFVNR